MTYRRIEARVRQLGDRSDAVQLQGFFKTGKGQYGEGDRFLGIRVPVLRKCVKEYRGAALEDILRLLKSPWHEIRLLALLMLVAEYKGGTPAERRAIYRAYLAGTKYINNWDLVDLSAEHIVGAHLNDRDRKPLYRLARSSDLWERRIAIVSTFYYIRRNDFTDTLGLADVLLNDGHDLIHKAVGWMLREVGKRDAAVEREFLRDRYAAMPRTMLRYAIERFPERERQAYLRGLA